MAGIPGGQPSVGRRRADWAASADEPRRLSVRDTAAANSSGRSAALACRTPTPPYSAAAAAAASIIRSRCSVRIRSRSTASALAPACNSCDGRDAADDDDDATNAATAAAGLPSDDRRSRSCISLRASREFADAGRGRPPPTAEAAAGRFSCGSSDVKACPDGAGPVASAVPRASEWPANSLAAPRKPAGGTMRWWWSDSLWCGRSGWRCGGDRGDRDRSRAWLLRWSGEWDLAVDDDELPYAGRKLNSKRLQFSALQSILKIIKLTMTS